MLRSSVLPAIVVALAVAAGCNTGIHSPAGFRLPAYGDVQRGQTAFLELKCNSCHEVHGMSLPRPTVQPVVPVKLGGPTSKEVSDGYLVTSIINPSHKLARARMDLIAVGGKSRMPEYADEITVRQMTDLVAFLQSRYTVLEPVARYPNY